MQLASVPKLLTCSGLGGMQRGKNPAEPVLHVAKGAIGWSPYGVFDPSRAEPRE